MLDALAYESWILHALIWLPFVGAIHVLWAEEDRAKHLALLWSLVVFVLSVGLWWAVTSDAIPSYRKKQSELEPRGRFFKGRRGST